MKFKFVSSVAAIALALAAGSSAQAALLTYTFDAGSLFDFGSGNTYSATGSFTLDTVSDAISSVTYQPVQIGSGPTGPFIFTAASLDNPTTVTFSGDGYGDLNTYYFASSLYAGGTIAITGGSYPGSTVSASGSVTAPAVPEPSSWILMTVGIGVAGAALRRRSQAHTTVSYA